MDTFLFIATILSMIATAAIVHIICKHAQLKALLMGITFQMNNANVQHSGTQ